MGMKKIGGRLLVGTWKVLGKCLESSGVRGFAKRVGMGFAKLRGYVGFEKCVKSAWKVCGKFEGMGVESAWVWAWKVRGKCVESLG